MGAAAIVGTDSGASPGATGVGTYAGPIGAAAVVGIYAGAGAKLEQTIVGTPGHGPHVHVFATLSVHVVESFGHASELSGHVHDCPKQKYTVRIKLTTQAQ